MRALLLSAAALAIAASIAVSMNRADDAHAGVLTFHGISMLKACSTTPAVAGDPYSCRYQIRNNVDDAPDTLTISSIVDRIDVNGNGFGDAGDIVSGNLLPQLTLTLQSGASCNAGQTNARCRPAASSPATSTRSTTPTPTTRTR